MWLAFAGECEHAGLGRLPKLRVLARSRRMSERREQIAKRVDALEAVVDCELGMLLIETERASIGLGCVVCDGGKESAA